MTADKILSKAGHRSTLREGNGQKDRCSKNEIGRQDGSGRIGVPLQMLPRSQISEAASPERMLSGSRCVTGHQSCNAWISFAGRCYLVAPEHIRKVAPDETCSLKPLTRQGLEEPKKASRSEDYVDITHQEAIQEELKHAAEQPAGNDHSGEPVESVVLLPIPEKTPSASAAEVKALELPEEEIVPKGALEGTKQDVEMHLEEALP